MDPYTGWDGQNGHPGQTLFDIFSVHSRRSLPTNNGKFFFSSHESSSRKSLLAINKLSPMTNGIKIGQVQCFPAVISTNGGIIGILILRERGACQRCFLLLCPSSHPLLEWFWWASLPLAKWGPVLSLTARSFLIWLFPCQSPVLWLLPFTLSALTTPKFSIVSKSWLGHSLCLGGLPSPPPDSLLKIAAQTMPPS